MLLAGVISTEDSPGGSLVLARRQTPLPAASLGDPAQIGKANLTANVKRQ
jgi:hypothetical protein